MPDLKELGDRFYNLKLNSKYVRYWKNNYGAVNNICNAMTDKLRKEMYPGSVTQKDCLLDWHKIFAVHVLAFLTNKLYSDGDTTTGRSVTDRLANEYYCLLLLKTIARAWHKSNGAYCELIIPVDYEQCLIKIFYKYRQSGLLNVTDTTFTYALASIAYFLEKCFLVHERPLKKDAYPCT
jgi:hypothetical protein